MLEMNVYDEYGVNRTLRFIKGKDKYGNNKIVATHEDIEYGCGWICDFCDVTFNECGNISLPDNLACIDIHHKYFSEDKVINYLIENEYIINTGLKTSFAYKLYPIYEVSKLLNECMTPEEVNK